MNDAMTCNPPKKHSARAGVVYFFRAAELNRVKIGYSSRPVTRFIDVQLCSPTELERVGFVAGGRDVEIGIHERFAHLRVRGEWFREDGDLTAFIRENVRPWRDLVHTPGLPSEGRQEARLVIGEDNFATAELMWGADSALWPRLLQSTLLIKIRCWRVSQIRRLRSEGVPKAQIALSVGVPESEVYAIGNSHHRPRR